VISVGVYLPANPFQPAAFAASKANNAPSTANEAKRHWAESARIDNVKAYGPSSPVDHYLIARAQACVTGADAHDIYAMLGNYHELCLIADGDETVKVRVLGLERRLRSFCQTAELARANVQPSLHLSTMSAMAGAR
jgi:hypothetical protein